MSAITRCLLYRVLNFLGKNFSLHQGSLMLLLLLSFYSHLHLLLSLASLRNDWLLWQLVGHVMLNWGKAPSKLIQFTNHLYSIWTRNTSKLLCKSYNMDEKSLKKIDNELHVKKKKCVKQKHPCVFYFPNQSSGVHY